MPAEPRDEIESEGEDAATEADDDGASDEEEVEASEDDAEEGDEEAVEDQPRDLALAEESSHRPGNGREVTSRPSDADQRETSDLVIDVIVNGEDPPILDADPGRDPRIAETADDEEA